MDIHVQAWRDAVVDQRGYNMYDPYIEMFWLPVLGPTATWLARRLVAGLEHSPDGYAVNMEDLARSIGVAYTEGKHNPFARALHRCVMFGVAQQIALLPHHSYSIRQNLPQLPQRHLNKLPEQLQIAHHDWILAPAL